MLKFIGLFLLVSVSVAEIRKIAVFVNPGCGEECHKDKSILVHVTADGANDTLHHIWDFTYKPTVILAVTPLNTSLSVNWTNFLSGKDGAMNFSSLPLSVFSFVIDQLIEFNDVNQTAVYDPTKFNSSNAIPYNTHHFEWKFDKSKLTNNSDLAVVVLEGKHHSHHDKKKLNGKLIVTLSAFGTLDHSTVQPHLLHTINASQIDIALDGLSTKDDFKSRFALGLKMASKDCSDEDISMIERKSLDDEHSPGVFKIVEVQMNRGYLLWRSVAYTSAERMMTSSTVVSSALYPLARNDSFHHTAISALFGNHTEDMNLRSSMFSFGQPGITDDLYSQSRYLSWTFLGGVGKPTDDSYSLLVQLVTIIGLGLPAVLALAVLSCILVKHLSKRTHDIVFAEQ